MHQLVIKEGSVLLMHGVTMKFIMIMLMLEEEKDYYGDCDDDGGDQE